MTRPALGILLCAILSSSAWTACEKKQPAPKAPPSPAKAAPAAPPIQPIPLAASLVEDNAALVKALRAGGLVIVMRHAKTNMEEKDEQGTDYANCATQRNLNDAGRAQAAAIGEAFKAIGVPVGEVISSPFCRNKETAQLAFGRCTLDDAAMGEDAASVTKRRALIARVPEAGKNTVIMSHQKSMSASTMNDLFQFDEGAGLLFSFKADGGGSVELIAMIDSTRWAKLAEVAKGMGPG